MSDILKENTDILMNTKVRVRTLEENKVILLVLYYELEIALVKCAADSNLYGTGLTDHKLFKQKSVTLRMYLEKGQANLLFFYF